MVQFNKKNKLKNLYEIQLKNEIDLERKNNKQKRQYIPSPPFKRIRTLYDSGWISVSDDGGGNILGPGIEQDPLAYGALRNYADPTVQKNQEVPLDLYYFFMQEINVNEAWLPFIKSTLMVRSNPKLKTVGVMQYRPYEYNPNEYFEIKGGTTLIYKGYDPFGEQFSQGEIDDGHLLISNTSKWFKGTLEWDQNDGIARRMSNAWLINVRSFYNYSYTEFEGHTCPNPNYESFMCPAIDSVSSNSVTGTGTWEHVWYTGRWYYGGVVWDLNVENEKNKHFTAPLFGARTTYVTAKGYYYEDDVYKGLQTKMAIHGGGPYPEYPDYTITEFDFPPALGGVTGDQQLYKLFYSNKRARQFDINGYYELTNMPQTSDYQSETLPYSHLYVKVNPDPYPETQLDDEDYYRSNHMEAWGRITPVDAKKQKFNYYATGNIQLLAPATQDIEKEVDFVDEVYSSTGYGYEKDEDNRDDKIMPNYVPGQHVVEFRLKLTLVNPKYYKTIRGFKK